MGEAISEMASWTARWVLLIGAFVVAASAEATSASLSPGGHSNDIVESAEYQQLSSKDQNARDEDFSEMRHAARYTSRDEKAEDQRSEQALQQRLTARQHRAEVKEGQEELEMAKKVERDQREAAAVEQRLEAFGGPLD